MLRRLLRGRGASALISLAAVIASYAVAEGVFRALRYRELRSVSQLDRVRVLDSPLLRLDAEMGFRYLPNKSVLQLSLESGVVVRTNTIRINNTGHLSARPYSVDPPAGVFRIAVIGDSFTACSFNDFTWSDLLQDLLNEDPSLAEAAGVKRFEVLNFGMDGTGFLQWPSVYAHDVSAYRPNLVLIAFIESDLWRPFKWMDTFRPYPGADYQLMMISESLPVNLDNPAAFLASQIVLTPTDAADPLRRQRMLQEALALRRAAMPWLSLRPELIGTLLTQADWPTPRLLSPRLQYRPDRPPRRGISERLANAVRAIRSIESEAPVFLLHLPLETELVQGSAVQAVDRLLVEARPTPAASLVGCLLRRTPGRQAGWFLRNNLHLSDEGVRVYAGAILETLRGFIRPPDVRTRARPLSETGPATRAGPRANGANGEQCVLRVPPRIMPHVYVAPVRRHGGGARWQRLGPA